MKIKTASILLGSTLAFGGVLAVVDGATSDADAALPRCLTQVIAYEDGTWVGGQVTIDNRKVADAWLVTGPRYQGQTWRNSSGKVVRNFAFPPTFAGQPCQSYVGG